MNRVSLLKTLSIVALVCVASAAHAWKPITHAYLAELAIDEALNSADGKVTIYAVDYFNGQIKRDSRGNKIVVGRYAADPTYLSAIRGNRRQYFAGVCGPDAYPDILTGQEIIHPAGRNTNGEPAGVDVNTGGPGSNAWLQHIYDCAFKGKMDQTIKLPFQTQPITISFGSPADKAFVLGFFAHAAGDMFAHTYINNYTGAPFNLPKNAIQHVVMEGYLQEKTPPFTHADDFNVSLDGGVSDFVYNCMVRYDNESKLRSTGLISGVNTVYSIPYIFSVLRDSLRADIKAYYAKSGADQVAYSITHPGFITYKEHWVDDIDSGLKAWPAVSRDLSVALFFSPDRKMHTDTAKTILNNYVNQHLLSMAGAPDFVGIARGIIQGIIDDVLNALNIPAIKQAIAELKEDVIDFILVHTFGVTLDQIKSYVTDPANQFDPVLNTGNVNPQHGQLISRAQLDQQLHLNGSGFDTEQFPAAYNTVTMIKLTLLSTSELNRLLKDLNDGDAQGLSASSNAMLGFIETLDGSDQWRLNDAKMILAKNEAFYRSIFMRQPGELPYPNIASASAISNQAQGNPTFALTVNLRPGSNTEADGTEVGFSARVESGDAVPLDLPNFMHLDRAKETATVTGVVPGVAHPTTYVITASDGSAQDMRLTVNPARLAGIYNTSTTRSTGGGAGGVTTTTTDYRAVVCLDAAAPPGGAVIALSSDHPEIATVPATVTVPAGETTVDVRPNFLKTDANATFTMTATYNGISKSIQITFQASRVLKTPPGQQIPEYFGLKPRPGVMQKLLNLKLGDTALPGAGIRH